MTTSTVWLTWLAVGGVGVIATGQLALVAGVITLDTSFLTGGLGVILPRSICNHLAASCLTIS